MAQPAVNRQNNVLVDRNNNIERKPDQAYQTRENDQWKNVDTSKIDTLKIDGSRVDTSKISQGHFDTSNIADYKQSRGNVDISGLERHNRARSPGAHHEMRARHAGVVAVARGGASPVKSWICGQTPGVSPAPV